MPNINRIISLIFTALAAAVLVGCATTAAIDPKSEGLRKIGVVSVAGAYLTQMNVGFTALGNENVSSDISIWKLDDKYASIVADAVQKSTRIDTVAINAGADLLKPMFNPSSLQHVAFDLDARWSQAQEKLKSIAKENGVDALVLLSPMTSGDYFSLSNQILQGLGIYTRSLGNRKEVSKLHLICRLVVISGKTGKPIGHVPVSLVQPTIPGGPHQRGQPSIDISDAIARINFSSMTATQKTELWNLALAIPLEAAVMASVPQLFNAK